MRLRRVSVSGTEGDKVFEVAHRSGKAKAL